MATVLLPYKQLPVQSKQEITIKIDNNEDIRTTSMTSFWCFYC